TLMGSGCQRGCETTTTTTFIPGDGCCPSGGVATDDPDCPTLELVGHEHTVCSGAHQWPTVAVGGDRIAVGCMPTGGQNVTPEIKFLDGLGNLLVKQTLLTSNGYYYTDIQLTYVNDKFQTIYQYNCDDNGSWNVGWGWGCINFREYASNGTMGASLVFGEVGHNGHPVMAWSGQEFGVAWVSYDDFYWRRIDAARKLVDADPLENTLIGYDPDRPDQRDGARTKIVWDPNTKSFATFFISDHRIFFARVTGSSVLVAPTYIGPGYSQTFGGQFKVLYAGGAYHVLYLDPTTYDVKLVDVSPVGVRGTTKTIQSAAGRKSYVHPDMVAKDGKFYIVTNDHDSAVARLRVVEPDGTQLREGVLVAGRPMGFPVIAYDPANARFAIAYLDQLSHGNVKLQLFAE
ncbi:MAG: hypothetical protein JRH20_31495, partial [Deltaproteobacteria bacterium]|nr:hypothetical protein [Deltaproteobacteria bacterium]